MTWEKAENITVKGIYFFFLFLAALMIITGLGCLYIKSGELFTDDMQASMFIHLIPCLYVAVIGLWCFYKKYDIGYVCLGILIIYGLSQLYYVHVWCCHRTLLGEMFYIWKGIF